MASLLLFGATGKTGTHFLNQALAAGHHVTAVVRDPAKVTVNHACLRVVKGDMTDPASLEAAFDRPYDAAVSALGVYLKAPGTPLADGTRPIIAALQRHGVKRFAVVSSVGTNDTKGIGPWWVRAVQRFVLKYTLIDKSAQENLIIASGLDWTLIRPPRLMDRPPQGGGIIRWQGANPAVKVRWQVSRSDVAAELLRAVSDPKSIGQAYQISEPA